MAILQHRIDDTVQIALEGPVDIGEAAELKTALLRALVPGNKISVLLGGITDLDVTAFQLLWAAARAAERSGVELVLQGPLPDSVRNRMAALALPELPVSE